MVLGYYLLELVFEEIDKKSYGLEKSAQLCIISLMSPCQGLR